MFRFTARLLACSLAGLVGVSSPAFTQAVLEVPIMGSQSTETAVQQTIDETYRILVVGDALAGGLGAGLARMSELEGGFEIVNRFQEVSGLARPEVYDWPAKLPNIMENKDFDAVVVLLGANDRQSMRVGDFRYVFNTPDWLNAYRAQTDHLLDVLTAAKVKIFWVAIPPMGDALYENDMKILNALQKQEVESRGGVFVDVRAAFLNADGSYTDSGEDDTGEVRKLRARDGVTFFKQGNNRFGQLLLAEIKKNMDGNPAEGLPANVVVLPPPSIEAIPMFGQDLGDGRVAVFQPEKLSTPEAARLAVNREYVSRADMAPGSAAEKLFVGGEASPAPRGRFDDFSYSPQP